MRFFKEVIYSSTLFRENACFKRRRHSLFRIIPGKCVLLKKVSFTSSPHSGQMRAFKEGSISFKEGSIIPETYASKEGVINSSALDRANACF